MCDDSTSGDCKNKGNDVAIFNTVQKTCIAHCVFHGVFKASVITY